MKYDQLTIGGDPEAFVFYGTGELVKPDDHTKGTKEFPAPITLGKETLQGDGLAFEFNVQPSKTFADFWNSVEKFEPSVLSLLPDQAFISEIELIHYSSVYTTSSLRKQNVQIGCSPEYDASTKNVAKYWDCGAFRATGGHIHMGWKPASDKNMNDYEHFMECCYFIQILSPLLMMMDLKFSKSKGIRRKFFGSGYAFRPTRYGAEARVPGNWWLFDEERCELLFDVVKKVFQNITTDVSPEFTKRNMAFMQGVRYQLLDITLNIPSRVTRCTPNTAQEVFIKQNPSVRRHYEYADEALHKFTKTGSLMRGYQAFLGGKLFDDVMSMLEVS